MTQYIDKSALVAEIDKMQDTYISKLESRGMKHEDAVISSVSYVNGIKDIINTIEVKEVDLDKDSLIWEDIRDILELYDEVTSMDYCNDIYGEILKRFKAQK